MKKPGNKTAKNVSKTSFEHIEKRVEKREKQSLSRTMVPVQKLLNTKPDVAGHKLKTMLRLARCRSCNFTLVMKNYYHCVNISFYFIIIAFTSKTSVHP